MEDKEPVRERFREAERAEVLSELCGECLREKNVSIVYNTYRQKVL